MRGGVIFGFRPTALDAPGIVARLLAAPPERGVGLLVTPNIDHVRLLRADPTFAAAYAGAAVIACDGFPVAWYARLRGCTVAGRVTGCDILHDLMRADALARHRLFFIADGAATVRGLRAWAARYGIGDRVAIAVPPPGFERNPGFCRGLAARIGAHGTTLLVLGVGAPRSEVFVHSQREALPACWALCVGQALRIEAGTARRAPALLRGLNLEWLWRVAAEPRRLTGRYVLALAGFVRAVLGDLVQGSAQGSA